MMQMQRPIEVDADDFVPERGVALQKRNSLVPAGDIGEQFRRPRLGLKCLGGMFYLRISADIGFVTERLAATAATSRDRLRGTAFVQVEYADDAAFLHQSDCGRASDPARSPG